MCRWPLKQVPLYFRLFVLVLAAEQEILDAVNEVRRGVSPAGSDLREVT